MKVEVYLNVRQPLSEMARCSGSMCWRHTAAPPYKCKEISRKIYRSPRTDGIVRVPPESGTPTNGLPFRPRRSSPTPKTRSRPPKPASAPPNPGPKRPFALGSRARGGQGANSTRVDGPTARHVVCASLQSSGCPARTYASTASGGMSVRTWKRSATATTPGRSAAWTLVEFAAASH